MARTLLEHGWRDARSLVGGFEAWRKAGYPLEPKVREAQTVGEAAKNLREAEGDPDAPV